MMNWKRNLLAGLLWMMGSWSYGQEIFSSHANLFTLPRTYSAAYIANSPVIDGDINESIWNKAPWSQSFMDIEGEKKPAPEFQTRMKMLWNDSCLFIAAELEEPHVWATLKQHDQIIYYDNDFEVFIDPDNDTHQYFEIEVNAFNTILDLFMYKPYRNWSGALIPFDVQQLRSAVKVHGSINDPSGKDKGWTIEMAIPFRSLFIGNRWQTPKEGSLWRINFSRVQWHTIADNGNYIKKKDSNGRILPEENWVWSPQGVINMHFPERWGYLQFVKGITNASSFPLPYSEEQKRYLWLVYYRQKEFYSKRHRYAISLQELEMPSTVKINANDNQLKLESTTNQFMVYISDQQTNSIWSLNEQGLVQKQNKLP